MAIWLPVLALVLHHQFHGSLLDYLGLAIAVAASWIRVPGPGEPVLIAAGVVAAKHHLDIVTVVVVAWAAATSGGVVGWLLGRRAGRAVVIGRDRSERCGWERSAGASGCSRATR